MTRDEFTRWREDRITRAIFKALGNAAEQQQAAWLSISWDNGVANQIALTELRTRADAYSSIAETTYEGFCEWLGIEPEPLPMEEAA